MDKRNSQSSQSQELIELVALSGELSTEAVGKIILNDSYRNKVLSQLKKGNRLNTINKHGLKGYRLTTKSKHMLLAENPDRFEHCLNGTAETAMVSYEFTRRKRLHEISDALVTMHNAGVEIFTDRKPMIFSQQPQSLETTEEQLQIHKPIFYTSREIKTTDLRWNNIRGSSFVGTLLGANGAWLVYNTGNAHVEWRFKIEARLKYEMQSYLNSKLLPEYYNESNTSGLMLGSSMETLKRYLAESSGKGDGFDFLVNYYKSFYYIPNSKHGEIQLKFLTDQPRRDALMKVVLKGTAPCTPHANIDSDGLAPDGSPILVCYLIDIPRLVRFYIGLNSKDIKGVIVCFDYQEEFMQSYFGDRVEVKTINYSKFLKNFYPDEVPPTTDIQ